MGANNADFKFTAVQKRIIEYFGNRHAGPANGTNDLMTTVDNLLLDSKIKSRSMDTIDRYYYGVRDLVDSGHLHGGDYGDSNIHLPDNTCGEKCND